jgi:nicotinate-nucleotide adenylyltransferase
MRLLVLGGSFNPVHIGHLVMADEARSQFGYDLVVLVPSFRPPHKDIEGDPGAQRRLVMLRLAVEGDRGMAVDDCELARGGVSYTIDTIRDIVARYRPEGKPGLLIGDDLMPDFPSWREPDAIAREADLICAHRLSSDRIPFPYAHRYADNSLVPLSSSLVRARIASRGAFRYLLPSQVHDYIVENGLYGLR